jgi:uncharacterized membrane protein YeiH
VRASSAVEFDGSTWRYAFDTVALGAGAVTGAAGAVSRGLHPVVCVVASVTQSFGGILRDLLCRREVMLGSQSYAACTAAGACVYVALREAALRGVGLSLTARILLSSGTTVAVRVGDFCSETPLLAPMHGAKSAAMCEIDPAVGSGE